MKIGTVLGEIRLRGYTPGYENVVWKQIRLEDQVLVAADLVGAGSGDLVLVAQGLSADRYRMDLRCDALILGTLDKEK